MNFKKELAYREKYCTKCINYSTNLCEIRNTLDGKPNCIYFKEKQGNENCN